MSEVRTYFDVFELPKRFALDPEELERRYRERSKSWHPDRFSRAPAAERAAVLGRATDLNEAYRTLKSDTRRAEYLLKLHGIDVTREGPDNKLAVDPEFLMGILELREELVEARLGRDAARLAQLGASVRDKMAELATSLASGFARLESGDEAALPALTEAILAQRYYQRFIDEIAAHDEAEAEAAARADADAAAAAGK